MIDFYYQLRKRMIKTMQLSLKQVRLVLGFGVQEFGDLIGLTRQTINNLETGKNQMSAIQYIAVCAVIDNYVEDKPEKWPVLATILTSNDTTIGEDNGTVSVFASIEKGSLLKKWFRCLPDDSKMLGFSLHYVDTIGKSEYTNIAEHYKVFIDQSVLLEAGFDEVVKPLAAALKDYDNRFIVPLKVAQAVQQQLISNNLDEVSAAKRAMMLLKNMQQQGLLDIRGDNGDVNIITTFVSVFARFKCVNRLALITCDSKLAEQIDALNNDTIGGFNILVLTYTKEKGLHKWVYETDAELLLDTDSVSQWSDSLNWDDLSAEPKQAEASDSQKGILDVELKQESEQKQNEQDAILTGWTML